MPLKVIRTHTATKKLKEKSIHTELIKTRLLYKIHLEEGMGVQE